MAANLWCDKHRKRIYGTALTDGPDLDILTARFLAAFSQHPKTMKAVYHDPFVSHLAEAARLLGTVMACRCVACELGEDAVNNLLAAGREPMASAAQSPVVV